jgi:hypothetical protein
MAVVSSLISPDVLLQEMVRYIHANIQEQCLRQWQDVQFHIEMTKKTKKKWKSPAHLSQVSSSANKRPHPHLGGFNIAFSSHQAIPPQQPCRARRPGPLSLSSFSGPGVWNVCLSTAGARTKQLGSLAICGAGPSRCQRSFLHCCHVEKMAQELNPRAPIPLLRCNMVVETGNIPYNAVQRWQVCKEKLHLHQSIICLAQQGSGVDFSPAVCMGSRESGTVRIVFLSTNHGSLKWHRAKLLGAGAGVRLWWTAHRAPCRLYVR